MKRGWSRSLGRVSFSSSPSCKTLNAGNGRERAHPLSSTHVLRWGERRNPFGQSRYFFKELFASFEKKDTENAQPKPIEESDLYEPLPFANKNRELQSAVIRFKSNEKIYHLLGVIEGTKESNLHVEEVTPCKDPVIAADDKNE